MKKSQKKTWGGARKNSGAKPIPEENKKIGLSVYVEKHIVEDLGGISPVTKICRDAVTRAWADKVF